ncbi:hypothetical protein D9M68_525040 [compost metagenome]
MSRCTSSAVAPSFSSTIALVLCGASVTRASPASPTARRCSVPRVLTELLDSSTPCCSTVLPTRVTSPVGAAIRPVLRTRPAALPARRSGSTSLPRVLESLLPSVPMPLRITKASPAASTVWPLAVVMLPWLCASRPASST